MKLQGKDKDIVSGMSIILQSCKELKVLREDIDAYSKHIFYHCCRLAEKSGISVSVPRISQCQRHRSNLEYISVEDYFKKTISIPFLDHLIADITSRFTNHTKQAATLQRLLPHNITPSSSLLSSMNEAISFYCDDLPNANIVDEELCRWKSKWLLVPREDRPKTLTESMKNCCSKTFPNIFTLLHFSTLPLSSCSCERSGSALKRLNNYLRCTQTEQRLN